MSKLDPQVGDRVTLTHKDGATVTGVLGGLGLDGLADWWVENVGTFCSAGGWSVTAVEKPKPLVGSFVRAIDRYGHEYRLVVIKPNLLKGVWRMDDRYVWQEVAFTKWDHLRSWEVIQ